MYLCSFLRIISFTIFLNSKTEDREGAAIVQNVFWLIVTFEVICKGNFRHVQLPNCNLRFQHHLFGGHFENSHYSPQ